MKYGEQANDLVEHVLAEVIALHVRALMRHSGQELSSRIILQEGGRKKQTRAREACRYRTRNLPRPQQSRRLNGKPLFRCVPKLRVIRFRRCRIGIANERGGAVE